MRHFSASISVSLPVVHHRYLRLQSGLPERAQYRFGYRYRGGGGEEGVNNKTNVANVTATTAALTNDIIIELVSLQLLYSGNFINSMVDERRRGEGERCYNLWNEHWTLALHPRIMHLRYARLGIDIIGI